MGNRDPLLEKHSSRKLTQEMGHLAVFLYPKECALMFYSGGIPHQSHATQESVGLLTSFPDASGGQRSLVMSNPLLLPAPFAPSIRIPGLVHKVSCYPSRSLERPWSHISMDFVMGLPLSQGNKVILVVVDRFSKACHLIPLPKLPSAPQNAEIVLQHIFRLHGFPQDVVLDRGPQFASRFWKAFCQLIGASASLSSGFHPQSNGQTERTNQEIETTLRCLASSNPMTWSKHLIWAEFAHNTLHHSSTGMSPFECQFGYQPPLFFEQESEVGVLAAQHLVQWCHRVWKKARAALLKTSQLQQQQANRRRRSAPSLRPGQKVWLSSKDLPLRVEVRKLAPRFIGPFKVLRKVNPVSYRLLLPKSLRIHPTFHVSLLKPVKYSPLSPATRPPPAPQIIDGQPAYRVKRILDTRLVRGRRQFLVDWEGYGPEERSWFPTHHILDKSLIRDFHRLHSTRAVGNVRSRS